MNNFQNSPGTATFSSKVAVPGCLSLITVTRNNLESLKKTYASISLQTVSDFQWIVIDGGSTDGTPEYLETTNADWLSEPDQGLYDAMNKGIERSTGTYLLFLNAGDELATSDTLEKILDAIKDNPDFIYGDAIEEGHLKKAHSHTKINNGLFTHHQAMLYARAKIGDLRYSFHYKIAADYDFTARFLNSIATSNSKDAAEPVDNIIYLPIPICIFETGGISQTNAFKGRSEQFQIRKNLKMVDPLTNVIIFIKQMMIWNLRRAAPKLYWFLKSRIIR